MIRRPARVLVLVLSAIVLLLLTGDAASDLYTEVLWFDELGFADVFWTRVWAAVTVRSIAGTIGAALVLLNLWVVVRQLGPVHLRRRYGNLEIAEQVPRTYVYTGIVVAALLAGLWLSGIPFGGDAALAVLAWLNRAPWGLEVPLFQRDLSFFVFSLPVYFRILDYLLLVAIWCILLAVIGYVLVGAVRLRGNRLEIDETPRLHFAVLVALLVALFGIRYWIGRYDIVIDGTGFSGGVGYTDVHARLPAHGFLSVLSLGAALALLYGAWRRVWWPPLAGLALLLLASVGLGYVYPSLIQKLRVEPNQLEAEREYIRYNLEFTRRAYGLHELERATYLTARGGVPGWEEIAPTVERLPVWDPEQLQTVFDEVQSGYPYYHFPSVHYDRYGPPGAEQQVAIAVREFTPEGLTEGTRTWQTLHLNPQQVRGAGAVLVPVAEKTPVGDPVFWLSDVAVRKSPAAPAGVELIEPAVYFGESAEGYLVFGSARDSAALPLSRRGSVGVQLSSFARLLAFALRFNEEKLLFAGELTDSSRIVFHRRVTDRVARIAPFLIWDADAHPVIANGRIVWLVDGFTYSRTFPLAPERRFGSVADVRYLRNSVKATVDAVTGQVAFYALDDGEPVLDSYRRIFPGLIHPLSALPPELASHLRYPVSYLQQQADILGEYHVSDPDVFFGGENQWEVPDEQAVGASITHRPMFMMRRLPNSERPEFLAILPFIARERQNMTALLLVRNEIAHYGEKVLLEFPRDRLITGPRQVQSLLLQDPEISARLSLLSRGRGEVQHGRLRVVPLDSAILYVQPLYLSAGSDETSIPQLQLVVASDGSSLGMAETLGAAVNALYRGESGAPAQPRPTGAPSTRPWPQEALLLLDEAQQAAREGDWAAFGELLRELRALLTRLSNEPAQE